MSVRLAAWKYSLLSVEQMFKKPELLTSRTKQNMHAAFPFYPFLSTFHVRPDTQPLLSFHPSHVVNFTDLDSSEEDDDDDKM